ncbi:MAG: hypothetical protein B7C24_13570 [Bacteroidetes bacterium 4572_77]|nr:MAG: hypothetical protein B7C24_13570 [Bacteroidetes bacterium 4572_77]
MFDTNICIQIEILLKPTNQRKCFSLFVGEEDNLTVCENAALDEWLKPCVICRQQKQSVAF